MEKVFVNCLTTHVSERQTGVKPSLGGENLTYYHFTVPQASSVTPFIFAFIPALQ